MVKKALFWISALLLIIPSALAIDQWYNLTNFTDKDELVGMMQTANQYSRGVFGIAIYVGFFLLMLFLFSDYPTKEAFAAASFITALVGLVLLPLGFINPWVILVVMLLAVGYLVALFM